MWEFSLVIAFYIFHRHRVCVVELVDLICNLYSRWEGFWSSSLATLPLDFNCDFISTSTCELSTGVCSSACPGGLGSAPVKARWGGGAAAWLTGILAALDTQGSWWLWQQEINALEGHGNQSWPICSSILTWRTPVPDREAWQATAYRVAESDTTKVTLCTRT